MFLAVASARIAVSSFPAGSRTVAWSPAAMPRTSASGTLRRECRDQRVPPPAVAHPHSPEVAVVLASLEEVCERALLDSRAAAIDQPLLLAERLDEVGRRRSASRSASAGASVLLAEPA